MNQIMIIETSNPNYYNQYSSNPVQNKLNYLLMCLSCPNAPLSVLSKRSTVCRVQTLHCLSCPNAPLSAVSKRSTVCHVQTLHCLSCPNAPLSAVSKRSTVCRVQTLHCLSCPNAPLSAVSKRSTFGVSATAVSPAIKFLVSCVRVENTRNTVTVGTLTIE